VKSNEKIGEIGDKKFNQSVHKEGTENRRERKTNYKSFVALCVFTFVFFVVKRHCLACPNLINLIQLNQPNQPIFKSTHFQIFKLFLYLTFIIKTEHFD